MTTERTDGEWDQVVRQQAAVARLGQVGLQTHDVEDVLREALLTTAEVLGVEDVAFFELLPGWGALRGRAAFYAGQVVPRATVAKFEIPSTAASMPGYAAQSGRPVVSHDLLADARFNALAPEYDMPVTSAVAAPIRWGDQPWGVLGVWSRAARTWTDDEVHFVQAVASTVGLTVQRSAVEQELRDSSLRLDLSLAAGGLGTWSWDLDQDTVRLNAAALAMHGLTAEEFGGAVDELLAHVHPEDRQELRTAVGTGEGEQHHLFRVIRRDNGEVRWLETWGRLLAAPDGRRNVVGVSTDVTDRRRAEEQKELMLAREHAARLEAEGARERLAFLAEASARLSTSLDPDVTLTNLADLCVPYLADVCLIDLIDDEGSLAEHAGRAVTDDALAAVRELRRRRAELGGVGGVYSEMAVAIQARSVLHTEITPDDWAAASVDEEHLEVFRRFNPRSAVVAPLIARGRVIGVISLLSIREGRRYSADEFSLIEEFATRAALAIDNGKLFHSRNRVARSLQSALLPPALPVVAGLQLAARYQVAEADVAIGGDFYDVIEVGEQRWGVVVGDVCGRGPDAAALTGLIRHSVRTVVVREEQPSAVLAQTNAAVIDQIDDSKFCTAAYLRISLDDRSGPGSVHVVASSAGHPRPAIVRADGGAELMDCAGTLLGVVANPTLVDVEADLHPGDAVVLYTDGVTEARDGHELFGEKRLLGALGALAGRSADDIATGLEAAVAAFRRSANDDTAIVVIQAAPAGWQPRPAGTTTTQER